MQDDRSVVQVLDATFAQVAHLAVAVVDGAQVNRPFAGSRLEWNEQAPSETIAERCV
jgi:hypothetical protein